MSVCILGTKAWQTLTANNINTFKEYTSELGNKLEQRTLYNRKCNKHTGLKAFEDMTGAAFMFWHILFFAILKACKINNRQGLSSDPRLLTELEEKDRFKNKKEAASTCCGDLMGINTQEEILQTNSSL